MPVFVVEQATVYRANGRRYFSRSSAIRGYAKGRIREKHPCECEGADYESNYPGFDCGCHALREKVLPRFVRVIRKALRKQAVAKDGRGSLPEIDPHVTSAADPKPFTPKVTTTSGDQR